MPGKFSAMAYAITILKPHPACRGGMRPTLCTWKCSTSALMSCFKGLDAESAEAAMTDGDIYAQTRTYSWVSPDRMVILTSVFGTAIISLRCRDFRLENEAGK